MNHYEPVSARTVNHICMNQGRLAIGTAQQ